MGFKAIKKKADALFKEAGYIAHINNKAEYELALALMDNLIEDYDNNKCLIEESFSSFTFIYHFLFFNLHECPLSFYYMNELANNWYFWPIRLKWDYPSSAGE